MHRYADYQLLVLGSAGKGCAHLPTSQEVALDLLKLCAQLHSCGQNLDGLPVAAEALPHLCQDPHEVHLGQVGLCQGQPLLEGQLCLCHMPNLQVPGQVRACSR